MHTQTLAKRKLNFRKINKQEPQWLYNLRKNNWISFIETPVPDRVKHLWKYTDPEQFLVENPQDVMDALPPVSDLTIAQREYLTSDFAAYGYNRPDRMTFAMLNDEFADSGLIFKDLHSAVIEHEDLVGNHLGHLVGGDFGILEAMNLALWNTGLFVYIPDNAVIDKPIRLRRHPAGATSFHRLLVVTGKNAQATIIDDYSGSYPDRALTNSAVELFIGDGSQVRYANTQRLDDNCKSYITQRAKTGRDARVYTIFGALGGSVSKVNAGSVLAGQGADSKIYGILFGNDNQHFDFHTRHHHTAGNTTSNIDVKVVLKDKAVSAYTGLIKINEDALNCEAFQENRNLLLNQGPRAESIPELEILCDQVSCSHGATMGPLDQEMLFYLTSRGIAPDVAVKTIISGFVEPTVRQLPVELRDAVRDSIMEKLGGV